MECLRCNSEMKFLEEKEFQEGSSWGVISDIGHLFDKSQTLLMYYCPKCGYVEFRVGGKNG